jgi:hypothetical protein
MTVMRALALLGGWGAVEVSGVAEDDDGVEVGGGGVVAGDEESVDEDGDARE